MVRYKTIGKSGKPIFEQALENHSTNQMEWTFLFIENHSNTRKTPEHRVGLNLRQPFRRAAGHDLTRWALHLCNDEKGWTIATSPRGHYWVTMDSGDLGELSANSPKNQLVNGYNLSSHYPPWHPHQRDDFIPTNIPTQSPFCPESIQTELQPDSRKLYPHCTPHSSP